MMRGAAAATSSRRPLRVGMFGGGVVGGGVYELVRQRLPAGLVEIVKIAVRDPAKSRTFEIDASQTVVTANPDDLLLDDALDCIVEVMGGVDLAKQVVTTALSKGKAVVTANKALLAQELDVLQALSTSSKAPLCYEAAVCGGIPIIHVLQTCYAGDVLSSVSGICNGTTNYMLCQMEAGAEYGAALREAQELGYAEADPTADVEGHDVRAKIALLAKLAFGVTVLQDNISVQGISQITSADFANAANLNATIKLLGVAQHSQSSSSSSSSSIVSVYVCPHIVPRSHPLASASGSGNAVLVDSRNLGVCQYTGPGAGRYPTANSVVADLSRVANQLQEEASGTSLSSSRWGDSVPPPFPRPAPTSVTIETDFCPTGDWYVRMDGNGNSATTAAVTLEEAVVKNGVTIRVNHTDSTAATNTPTSFVTLQPCPASRARAFARDIQSGLCMPLINAPPSP